MSEVSVIQTSRGPRKYLSAHKSVRHLLLKTLD